MHRMTATEAHDFLDRGSLLGAKYMGEDQAEAFGARNGVAGELVVRLRPTAIHGYAKVAE